MSRPVIAYHIIFGAYGFWLPNDPRGSMSKYVFAPRLQSFGPPCRVREDTTLTAEEADRLQEMRAELQYPPVRFSENQIAAIAKGFGEIINNLGLVLYAAALMPDHVHAVAARQGIFAETIAGYLKRAASRELRSAGLHPLARFAMPNGRLPTPWAEHGWKIFCSISPRLSTRLNMSTTILGRRGCRCSAGPGSSRSMVDGSSG